MVWCGVVVVLRCFAFARTTPFSQFSNATSPPPTTHGTGVEAKIAIVESIKEGIEIVSNEYTNFLSCYVPAFEHVLKQVAPQTEKTQEHKLRNTVMEIIHRLPHNELLKSHVDSLMVVCLRVLGGDEASGILGDNEENALLALKVVLDLTGLVSITALMYLMVRAQHTLAQLHKAQRVQRWSAEQNQPVDLSMKALGRLSMGNASAGSGGADDRPLNGSGGGDGDGGGGAQGMGRRRRRAGTRCADRHCAQGRRRGREGWVYAASRGFRAVSHESSRGRVRVGGRGGDARGGYETRRVGVAARRRRGVRGVARAG